MKVVRTLPSLVLCLLLSEGVVFSQGIAAYTRSNPRFVAAFESITAHARKSVVRVYCNGQETALGMVIREDGWILTKANDLDGSISCQLAQGGIHQAKLVGVHPTHDLAMLKIDARGLTAVQFKDSRTLASGSWLVSPSLSSEPAAIGVVSVPTRTVPTKGQPAVFVNPSAGYLGVALDEDKQGARVIEVMPRSAAANAGLQPDDIIRNINGQRVYSPDDVIHALRRSKPGDSVRLSIQRDEMAFNKLATLGKRPATNRAEFQNNLGGALSSRRSGYPIILQHDSVLQPSDCGGPVVDLDGGVVGINVSRAGRTETWTVPSEVIAQQLPDLMSGRLAPKGNNRQVEDD